MDIKSRNQVFDDLQLESLDQWGQALYAAALQDPDHQPLLGEEFRKNRVRKDLLALGMDSTAVEYCLQVFPWLVWRGCRTADGLNTDRILFSTGVIKCNPNQGRGGLQVTIRPVNPSLPTVSVITAIFHYEPWTEAMIQLVCADTKRRLERDNALVLRPVGGTYSEAVLASHKEVLLAIAEDSDAYHIDRAGTQLVPYQAITGTVHYAGTAGQVSIRFNYDPTTVEITNPNASTDNVHAIDFK